jgi:hypothetical protein
MNSRSEAAQVNRASHNQETGVNNEPSEEQSYRIHKRREANG